MATSGTIKIHEHPNEHESGIRPGTFIIIRIDPLTSVEELDEQAAGEAAALKPCKVLALYDTVRCRPSLPTAALLTQHWGLLQ